MRTSRRLSADFAILLFLAAAPVQSQSPGTRQFDLLTASVADIQAAVGAGALTYEHLVQLYLDRIQAYNKNGPQLRAVIEANSHALEIARALDAERKTKGLRSPLHGIPVAVKDNIDVSDIPSAGGSLALAGTFPPHDATVIQRLRDAGAIIFLKTNMDELALGSQGLSSLGGQILNPYDLKRNPGGSSGGTGVAVNVGFATVGLGTETGVSIRSPASNNALIGIAPTRGLVSRAGVIPISFTQDRVGVHAKSVVDAALVLEQIRGFDPEDLLTLDSLGRIGRDSDQNHMDATLDSARIGVLRDLFRKGDEFREGNAIVEKQIDLIRDRHAIILDGLTTGMDLPAFMPMLRVNSYELRVGFDAYLRRRGPSSPVGSLAELAASGMSPPRLQNQFQHALKRGPLDFDAEYHARLENQRLVKRLLVDLMERYGLDALVYPLSSATGLPAIVAPAGLTGEGLPIAIEFLGRPFTEPRLIQLVHAYELASHRRVAPNTTPHLKGEVFSY
jgi:amidase